MADNSIQGIYKQIQIFEYEQKSYIYDRIYNETFVSLAPVRILIFFHEPPDKIVDCDREYHEDYIYGLAPAIEDKIYHKKPNVSEFGWDKIIYQQHYRQIYKQEKDAGKDHAEILQLNIYSLMKIKILLNSKYIIVTQDKTKPKVLK